MSLKLKPRKPRKPKKKKDYKLPSKRRSDIVGFIIGFLSLVTYWSLLGGILGALLWLFVVLPPENRRSFILHITYGLISFLLFIGVLMLVFT